jgi:integrase/recombinase XerC
MDSVVLMGRNGRPRQLITLPGHGKGIRPASYGLSYPPEPLSNEEALRLFAVIPQQHERGAVDRAGLRDRALLTLLWRTGLRISEALDLRCHHVDAGTRRVTVLHGKGDKRRTVGIDAGGLFALQPWLFERAMLGIDPAAPLFCTIQRPGRGGRIYPAYVRSKLHRYALLARIPKRVHPHLFRHSLACSLIEEGFSLTDVQAQLGHSNPATTAIYLRGLGADKAFARVAEREWPGGAS